MRRAVKSSLCALCAVAVAACAPSYKPDTYASGAMQQVNKVEPAIVVGFRQVTISASGTVGAVTGGAAGGVLGSRSNAYGVDSALGAIGGSVVGGLLGTTIEHATGDTTGWEYIVRKDNGELLSVTQREETPLQLGQKVLVIGGSQARVVADYSVPPEPVAKAPEPAKPAKPASPSFPLLVVPLSSESYLTSAPIESPPQDEAPAPPAAIADTIADAPREAAPEAQPEDPPQAEAPPEPPQQ